MCDIAARGATKPYAFAAVPYPVDAPESNPHVYLLFARPCDRRGRGLGFLESTGTAGKHRRRLVYWSDDVIASSFDWDLAPNHGGGCESACDETKDLLCI